MSNKNAFEKAMMTYKTNIRSIQALNNSIASLADNKDLSVIHELLRGMYDISMRFSSEDNRSDINIDDIVKNINDDKTFRENIIKASNDPIHSREIIEHFKRFSRQPPIQGPLIRRGALIILVSFFESLLSDLIQNYYKLYPNAMPSEDRNISLADLRTFGSIEKAEEYLILRETENVFRKGLEDQLEYFNKRMKINISCIDKYKDDLVEISQRRNIFVHNNGTINHIYMSKVSDKLSKKYKAKEGENISISSDYLNRTINIMYFSGIVINYICWRKWKKEDSNLANELLMTYLYEALVEKNHNLVIMLSDFAINIPIESEQNRRMVIINHSIALKELGLSEEMHNLLNQYDWSSCSLVFHLALYLLKDDSENFYNILPRCIASKEVTIENMTSWPLFRSMRKNTEFINIISGLFPDIDIQEMFNKSIS